MNKKLVHITTIILIISILAPSIIPVIAKPAPKYEKKVIIHYKKGYGKPPGTPGKGPDKDKPDEDGSYVLLAKGAKWKNTEDLLIDTSCPAELTLEFVKATITTSAQTWQDEAGFPLYGTISLSDECDEVLNQEKPDNKNEIVFGDYPEEGVIAVTIIWGIFGGPPKNREIVEFDMLFDSANFTWGDAASSVMDLQNIATHELGHGFGLGDLYDQSDSEETMYGYATEGETHKRDLYFGDIAGIQSLYGVPQ